MRLRRVFFALASVAVATVIACGHSGESPDPATAASPAASDSASDSADADDSAAPEASTVAKGPGDAPSMDDTADDGSCAGANCIRRCDKMSRPGDCAAAGDALRTGADEVKASPKRAMKYLEKACGLKQRDGCLHLAAMLAAGEGVPADVPRSITLLDQACEYGQGDACDDLARRAEAGDGMKKDHQKSIGYLGAGCVAEIFQVTTCSALVDYASKKDKDAIRVIDGWKKTCKASKDATACAGVERTKKK
jgi:hypothetical protein